MENSQDGKREYINEVIKWQKSITELVIFVVTFLKQISDVLVLRMDIESGIDYLTN